MSGACEYIMYYVHFANHIRYICRIVRGFWACCEYACIWLLISLQCVWNRKVHFGVCCINLWLMSAAGDVVYLASSRSISISVCLCIRLLLCFVCGMLLKTMMSILLIFIMKSALCGMYRVYIFNDKSLESLFHLLYNYFNSKINYVLLQNVNISELDWDFVISFQIYN